MHLNQYALAFAAEQTLTVPLGASFQSLAGQQGYPQLFLLVPSDEKQTEQWTIRGCRSHEQLSFVTPVLAKACFLGTSMQQYLPGCGECAWHFYRTHVAPSPKPN